MKTTCTLALKTGRRVRWPALMALLLLAGCKIELSVPPTGQVLSESGAYDCGPGQGCTIDVVDLFFDERFVAEPEDGFRFSHWRLASNYLCGGRSQPCELSTAAFEGHPTLMAFLESNDSFHLEPVFETTSDGPQFLVRYCEILIASPQEGDLRAQIFGTQGLNDCPDEGLQFLDLDAIAEDYNAAGVYLNGPRYWVLDDISLAPVIGGDFVMPGSSPSVLFGVLEMRRLTTVTLAQGVGTGNGHYRENLVARSTVWHYRAGRRVYQLSDPKGNRYLMQSYTLREDPSLKLEDLATLDTRLELPQGWTFQSYVLSEPLELPTVDGQARVITDDLGNTYQFVPE